VRAHSEELFDTMNFYCELMQEIKIRDRGIYELSTAKVPAQISYESCYLQLRIICELIAIASLVIHGDIAATSGKNQGRLGGRQNNETPL